MRLVSVSLNTDSDTDFSIDKISFQSKDSRPDVSSIHHNVHTISPHITIQTLELLIDKQSRHPLPGPDTHAGDTNLLLLPFSLAQDRTDLPCAGRAQRMTQCNSPTTRVHLSVIETQNAQAVHSHRGKGLVNLNDVNVILGQIVFGEEFRDGERGANAHDTWSDTGDGGPTEFCEDGLIHFLRFGAFHEEDCSGC